MRITQNIIPINIPDPAQFNQAMSEIHKKEKENNTTKIIAYDHMQFPHYYKNAIKMLEQSLYYKNAVREPHTKKAPSIITLAGP